MSVGVCGYITLSVDSIADKVDFSFCLMEQSVKCGLGCKLGGNVSCNAYSICEKDITKSTILMEIMDTPLDNYADDICQPSIENDDLEFGIDEKLKLNLKNLQKFLEEIINTKKVKEIVIYFNYEFLQDDDKLVEIQVNDFSSVMFENYLATNYSAPFLKIIIK